MRFVEASFDAFVQMELLDLARALARDPGLELELGLVARLDRSGLKPAAIQDAITATHASSQRETASPGYSCRVTVSQLWNMVPDAVKRAGLLSEVVLLAYGASRYTDTKLVKAYHSEQQGQPLEKLANQLLALAEMWRLEELCRRERPGAAEWLEVRRATLLAYYADRRRLHADREETAELVLFQLFALLYDAESVRTQQDEGLSAPIAAALLAAEGRIRQASGIDGLVQACRDFVAVLRELQVERGVHGMVERDTRSDYFALGLDEVQQSDAEPQQEGLLYDDLTRDNPFVSEGDQQFDDPKQADVREEKQELWSDASEQQLEQTSFLRFQIEAGLSSNLEVNGPARMSDQGDQALALATGSVRQGKQPDPADPEALLAAMQGGANPEAEAHMAMVNRHARAIFAAASAPTALQRSQYLDLLPPVRPLARKLQRTIEQLLEHRRTAVNEHRRFGRPGRKLERLYTEVQPRLFRKKHDPDRQVDAAFLLLVDCSASMADKMLQTRQGLALMHETLRALGIPHEVIGFWEDTDTAASHDWPNTFQVIMDHAACFHPHSGAKLLQLEPQQDNRDGFAIRSLLPRLIPRSEKHRVLIVFTDGRPSAAEYEQEGIPDTFAAVQQARRAGIEVFGVFLAAGSITDGDRAMMRAIYGRSAVIVPRIEELPQRMAQVLRKLLIGAV
ncbi:vWA domain-containing protein [Paenibacillus sp. y28]|uniref:vWA domain-containing protein n=1 Tax=Paenibacillus sp. y28 TaxID=3129110 RepID=UPI003019D9D6